MNQALKHKTLSAVIVDRLRQSILAGTYAGGEQLRQDALAKNFGVSRIPVREALFQLEAEGFVRMVAHKGAVVSELSVEEINDVFDLRGILETRLLATSVLVLDGTDFGRLQDIQQRFVESIARYQVREWGELNAEFHRSLYARSPLPRTQSIVAALLQTSDRYTRLQLSNSNAMNTAAKEHAELLSLCVARKVDEACSFLLTHIETVRNDLLRVVGGTLPASHLGV